MKYGIIYEYSNFGNTIQLISTYRNFEKPPIKENKGFSEQKDAVKILLLFDLEEDRQAFDQKMVLPRWSYSMVLAKRELKKIFNQFHDEKR